jgi:hypothetical protein
MNGTLDTENSNPGSPFSFSTAIPILWVNNSKQSIQWQNNALAPITWAAVGFLYQRVSQGIEGSGVFLGITLTGTFAGGSGGGGTSGSAQGLVITALVLEFQDKTILASRMNA